MEYITIWTNDLSTDEQSRKMIEKELKAGKAVHVDSSCIGHTRAAMVKAQGIELMKMLGAHEATDVPKSESWLGAFYMM